MTTATDKKKKAKGNLFDEDITSLYELGLPDSQTDAYSLQFVEIINDDEQYMLDAFHQQYVAVEGRSAIAQLVDTRMGEVATNASHVMAMTMGNIERIEAAAQVGRLEKRLQDFDNKLLDQTAKHILETNAIAVRTMHEDIRRNIYKPPPPPPRPKKKGLIRGFAEFLFGEP